VRIEISVSGDRGRISIRRECYDFALALGRVSSVCTYFRRPGSFVSDYNTVGRKFTETDRAFGLCLIIP